MPESPERPDGEPAPGGGPKRPGGRLLSIWNLVESGRRTAYTSLIVPSLSFDPAELAKISGVSFYEERLLFTLIRLRDPRARLIYVTSQPVHPDIIDYYLDFLDNVPLRHARERLHVLSVLDAGLRPLTEKILERPRFVRRLQRLIGDPQHAYLTCYNATALERRLAVELDIPLNGLDPALQGLCLARKPVLLFL